MNFSIIVIFKNCCYIDRVIDQILTQIEGNDEIIIVNDNSTEKHYSLLKKYLFHNNLRIINSTHPGCRSANRNSGAKLAVNEVLVFIDGDIFLYPNAFKRIRQNLTCQNYDAYAGNLHGLEYTEGQLSFIGRKFINYSMDKLLELHKDIILKDYRLSIEKNGLATDWEWYYFYTGLFIVKRQAFFSSGMFNENLTEWGAEDIEFAYRLSRNYRIKYDRALHGIHLPHPRNHIKNLKTNICNLYKLLNTYKNTYFELPIKFNNPGKVDLLLKENLYLNLVASDTFKDFNLDVNSISVDYAKKIRYKDSSSTISMLDLYGVALPFNNKELNKAYVSQNILIYGNSLSAIILQECLRIAKQVIVIKTDFNILNYAFCKEDENIIKSHAISNSLIHANTSMKNYNFEELTDRYIVSEESIKFEVDCI